MFRIKRFTFYEVIKIINIIIIERNKVYSTLFIKILFRFIDCKKALIYLKNTSDDLIIINLNKINLKKLRFIFYFYEF